MQASHRETSLKIVELFNNNRFPQDYMRITNFDQFDQSGFLLTIVESITVRYYKKSDVTKNLVNIVDTMDEKYMDVILFQKVVIKLFSQHSVITQLLQGIDGEQGNPKEGVSKQAVLD